ncbi:MAG: hypothetical protein ACREDZ_05400, partial [Kiloniellales bacterium]
MSGTARATIAITTLARYQTAFWLEVARRLESLGIEVLLIAFDDESADLIRAAGLPLLDMPGVLRSRPELLLLSPEAQARVFAENGIDSIEPLLLHEWVTFELTDPAPLLTRLAAYLVAIGERLDEFGRQGKEVTLLQESGGFLSVLSAFHAARARALDHWAIEPAFFRGRLFFIRNSLAALPIAGPGVRDPEPDLLTYLRDTVERQVIVVPRKDAHHYRAPWGKIVNLANAKRLVEKLIQKHLRGRHYEFGHIWQHVRRHLRMLWSGWRLRRSQRPLEDVGSYVYYPLHVPADMALTLRTPVYLDQLELIEQIGTALPAGVTLAVKEHPAQQGSLDADRMRALLERHPNVALLPPSTNNFEVLRGARLVISVNSKSGAEALLLRRPVIVLGDAFYRPSGLATRVDSLAELPAVLEALLDGPQPLAREAVERYFQAVWEA